MYRFVGGGGTEGPFSIINPTSGIIATSTQLDYEFEQTYTIYIEAYDGGGSDGSEQLTGQTSVVVNVLDVNDNGPRFPENSYTEKVREDVGENDVIIKVSVFLNKIIKCQYFTQVWSKYFHYVLHLSVGCSLLKLMGPISSTWITLKASHLCMDGVQHPRKSK